MGLSKWLINPHTGNFQFHLNLFTLQNKFRVGEMGQIDKPCVTDNCSVIPTESVTWGRFSYPGETCPMTQKTIIIFLIFFYTKIQLFLSLLSMASPASLSPHPAAWEQISTQWEISTKQTTHRKLAWVTIKGGLHLSHGQNGEGTMTHWRVWMCFWGRGSTTQGWAVRHPSAVTASLRNKSMSC